MGKSETSRLEALDALMAEKRKHEGYLAKLEDRRDSTPEHVFARLRDEYLTKLTDLQVRASAEAETLAESLKVDEAAVAEIEGRLAAFTEERIEGELRAEVGEYDPKEWAKKLEALDASIDKVEKERAAKVAVFEKTRALVLEARASVVESPDAAPPAAGAGQEPAPAASAAEPRRPVSATPAPPAAAVEAPRAGTPAAARASAPGGTPTVDPVRTSKQTPRPAVPTQPRPSDAVPAQGAVPPTPYRGTPPVAPAKAAPMAGSPSFDELAFLNSVVGRVSTPMKADEPPPAPRPSKGVPEVKDGTGRPTPRAPSAPVAPSSSPSALRHPDAEPPPAHNPDDEPANSALGRPTPRTSQAVKTLKCQECGTFNFPTEWYCERCGGELAAL